MTDQKKNISNHSWPDLHLISFPFAFQFDCNAAVNSNWPLMHPSAKLCLREVGYLTDHALNYTVTLCLE